MWVNLNAHCASCVPTTGYVGKGKRGEPRALLRSSASGDLGLSTACKPIVLNELLYII